MPGDHEFTIQTILNRVFDSTNNRLNVSIGAANQTVDDDVAIYFGTSNDTAVFHRSTALAADAEITNQIVGTSDHQGVAANSLIFSNITASGDILFLVNNGGNSLEALLIDASVPAWHLGYGLTGNGSVYAGSGNSFDVYINKVKEIDYATGALAFQQATTISTTTGALTIAPVAGQGITVGLAASSPAPDNGFMHVWAGSAGTVTAESGAVLVLERNAGVSLSLLAPANANGNILFGDPTNNRLHAIEAYGSSHASRPNELDFSVAGVEQLRWLNGNLAFSVATIINVLGGYLSLTERAAPGAGAADTVRIYAVVGGDTLTDLAAVFQDGTVAIFAQEATSPNDAIVAAPNETKGVVVIKRPHPGIVQLAVQVPGLGDWVISEKQFHNAEKLGWARGGAGSLPVDWPVESNEEMKARLSRPVLSG